MSFQIPVATRRSVTGIPTGRLGMWWIIASEIVIFGGLITCYLLLRLRHPEWAQLASQTNEWLGGFNTLVLLTSSYWVVKAHKAIGENDTQSAYQHLWMTIGGGFVFLIVKAIEYGSKLSHGITVTSDLFWSFYFLMTGLHATHVIAGMIAMAIVAQDVKKGNFLPRVEYAGIYWHFVDVVWIFLFPLLYIASGI